MSVQRVRILRYSTAFKLEVIDQIERGELTVAQAQRRYDIRGGHTISNWLRKFGRTSLLHQIVRVQTVQEKDQLKAMQQEIKKLKEALADAHMEKRILETLIDEANKIYKTDLKKNFGDSSSSNSDTTSP
jgi:transposase